MSGPYGNGHLRTMDSDAKRRFIVNSITVGFNARRGGPGTYVSRF